MSKYRRPICKFNIGDRVRVYMKAGVTIGYIHKIDKFGNNVEVICNREGINYEVHHKQCSLLKKKPIVEERPLFSLCDGKTIPRDMLPEEPPLIDDKKWNFPIPPDFDMGVVMKMIQDLTSTCTSLVERIENIEKNKVSATWLITGLEQIEMQFIPRLDKLELTMTRTELIIEAHALRLKELEEKSHYHTNNIFENVKIPGFSKPSPSTVGTTILPFISAHTELPKPGTLESVLPALRDGKKIKSPSSLERDYFIIKDADGYVEFKDDDGYINFYLSARILNATDWEILK